MLSLALERALKHSCHDSELLEVMNYAVLGTGKFFRPRLVEAVAMDLTQNFSNNHLHLAISIELHHAYTLVHDDLPAMDNDLFRRGKPSTHAQFGEWKAILAGDALLISSFNELNKISHANFRLLNKLMGWSTGAKGLIQGQFRDLASEGNLNIDSVVRIHELKTGRLIQLATLGAYLLTEEVNFRGKIEFLRLGREIGVCFQLLDDLSELTSPEISIHEEKINPFLHSSDDALFILKQSHLRLKKIISRYNLYHVENMIMNYLKDNQKKLIFNYECLETNLGTKNHDLKEWITSFV
jgi:geranylgeranyl pyrophosphate synthase